MPKAQESCDPDLENSTGVLSNINRINYRDFSNQVFDIMVGGMIIPRPRAHGSVLAPLEVQIVCR